MVATPLASPVDEIDSACPAMQRWAEIEALRALWESMSCDETCKSPLSIFGNTKSPLFYPPSSKARPWTLVATDAPALFEGTCSLWSAGLDGESHESVALEVRTKGHTTLMLRNIPNRVGMEDFLAVLDEKLGFEGKYDFCMLPTDIHSGNGKGYGFINFDTVEGAEAFCRRANGFQFPCGFGLYSTKFAKVSVARTQGVAENLGEMKLWSSRRKKSAKRFPEGHGWPYVRSNGVMTPIRTPEDLAQILTLYS